MHYFEPDDFEYKEPIWFHIPAIFVKEALFPFQSSIYQYILLNPHKRKNFKLIVYGCPGYCIWNGGRYMSLPMYRIETIEDIIVNYIYNLGIDMQFTFTNVLLSENDVYDRYGNALLDIINKYNNHIEILISSSILKEYIKNKYPDIKFAKSICTLKDINENELNDYSTFVLKWEKNTDKEYIKNISSLGFNIEILCDEACSVTCKKREEHYKIYNRIQLFQDPCGDPICTGDQQTFHNIRWIRPDMINDYIDLGIKHFKLSGRGHPLYMIEELSLFLFKNQHIVQNRLEIYEQLIPFLNGVQKESICQI